MGLERQRAVLEKTIADLAAPMGKPGALVASQLGKIISENMADDDIRTIVDRIWQAADDLVTAAEADGESVSRRADGQRQDGADGESAKIAGVRGRP